jgi:hypothetical protein
MSKISERTKRELIILVALGGYKVGQLNINFKFYKV